jgi:hypothetical protein
MTNITVNMHSVSAKCMHVSYDLFYRIIPFYYDGDHDHLCDSFYEVLYAANDNIHALGHNDFTVRDYDPGVPNFEEATFNFDGKSVGQVIFDMLDAYGGYLYRWKTTFGIAPTRDWLVEDRDFTIRYGKNLKGITKEENWEDVATQLQAIGKDGLNRMYINSIPGVTFAYNKVVEFQQNVNPNQYNSDSAYEDALVADLDAQALKYLQENFAPKLNYTVDARIGEFDGVPEITDLENKVVIIDEHLGIDVEAYVIGFDYDLIGKKFLTVEFGNYTNSMKGYNHKVNQRIGNLKKDVSLIAHPIGSYFFTNLTDTPNKLGIDGYWQYVETVGSEKAWKRVG